MDTDFMKLANDWHGGQDSGLYSLLSTGRFHGLDHMQECLHELQWNLRAVKRDPKAFDANEEDRLEQAITDLEDMIKIRELSSNKEG